MKLHFFKCKVSHVVFTYVFTGVSRSSKVKIEKIYIIPSIYFLRRQIYVRKFTFTRMSILVIAVACSCVTILIICTNAWMLSMCQFEFEPWRYSILNPFLHPAGLLSTLITLRPFICYFPEAKIRWFFV